MANDSGKLVDRIERSVSELHRSMRDKFTQPEYIPGCEVLSIVNKDEYGTDNGWIEAFCGQHNNQRVRYKGLPQDIQVGDFVDVEFFPNHKIFEVRGGGYTTGNRVSGVWSLEGGVGPDIYYDEGNVGVGLDNPDTQFQVLGDVKVSGIGSPNLFIVDYNANVVMVKSGLGSAPANAEFYVNAGAKGFIVTDAGRVGIGTGVGTPLDARLQIEIGNEEMPPLIMKEGGNLKFEFLASGIFKSHFDHGGSVQYSTVAGGTGIAMFAPSPGNARYDMFVEANGASLRISQSGTNAIAVRSAMVQIYQPAELERNLWVKDSTGLISRFNNGVIFQSRIAVGESNWSLAPTYSQIYVRGGNVLHKFSTTLGAEFGMFIAQNTNHFTSNAYYDGTWRAIATNPAVMFRSDFATGINMYSASSVAADAALTWVERWSVDQNGHLWARGYVAAGAVNIPASNAVKEGLWFSRGRSAGEGSNVHVVAKDWSSSFGIGFNAYYKDDTVAGPLNANNAWGYWVAAGGNATRAGMLYFQANTGGFGFYISPASTGQDNGISWGNPRLWIDATETRIGINTAAPNTIIHANIQLAGEGLLMPPAFVGAWQSDSAYAAFSHSNFRTAGPSSYAVLQDVNGHTFVNAASTRQLHLRNNNANMVVIPNGGFTLDVLGSAHATSFPTSSDERLKDDIRPISPSNAIAIIKQLQAVRFKWNKTARDMRRVSDRRNPTFDEIGLIGQNVESAAPELVTRWSNPRDELDLDNGEVEQEQYIAVDYSRLSALLIEAVKSQQTEIDALKQLIGRS